MTPADLEAARDPAPRDGAGDRRRQQGRQREARARRRRVPLARLGRDLRDLRLARPRHRRPARRDRLGAAARDEAELARKAREAEAEAWADEVAAGRLEPFVVGDPEAGDADGTAMAVDGPTSTASIPRPRAGTPRWPPRRTASPPRSRSSGRPNVGKSSLLNALLGEERAIVSEVPGTTRDAIDTRLAWGRSEVVLIDTAGIRRRGKVASGPAAERYSTLRALHALSRADVAVLVIDAVEGLTVAGRPRRGLRRRGGQGPRHRGQQVGPRRRTRPTRPSTSTSSGSATRSRSSTSPRSSRSAPRPASASGACSRPPSTSGASGASGSRPASSTACCSAATERTPPPPVRGHRPKLFYATQAAVAPPTFVFFASDASAVHFSYRRYLENRLRETFGFDGTPIRLVFRDRASVKLPRRKKPRSAPGRRGQGSAPGATAGRARKPR